MGTTSDALLVVRIRTPRGELCELWNPAHPLGVGEPLRWVLELRDAGKCLRLTDTKDSSRVESPIHEASPVTRFAIGTSSSISVHAERATRLSPAVAEESFGAPAQQERFKKSILQSVGALAVVLALLPFIRPSTRELVARAPVQVVDLSKLAQSAARPRASGGAVASSRLKALVQGSGSRWLARTPTSTLSGTWSERYVASFGNLAQAGSGGLSAIGKNGYSGSLGHAVGGGGTARNWVDLDSLAATVEEGLTKDEVGRIIHQHMKEIRYCYETAMIRSPDVEGKLVVQFTIGNLGSVRSTGVRSSSVPDRRLDDCVLDRLARWKFPQPKGGIEVAVTYPFIFKSLGK